MRLADIKIGKKLGFGFGAVLLLLAVISTTAFMNQRSSTAGFKDYRELARDSLLAGRLQAHMLMVRMNVKDFIITFNTHDNILEFRNGLITRARQKVEENINQYDVPSFAQVIRKILKYNRKRGFGFIGLQGTGKSIIIKKLEEILTDITIIKLGPEEFSTVYRIKKCFQFVRMIQPALVIIEDLDALGFKEKTERVGAFINEIDDTNNNLNIVPLITINDPELVHKTIIDRPGRFDEITEIKPPQTGDEAYVVMLSKFNKLKRFYTKFENIEFPPQKELEKILARCLENKFTQAELTCGIIEKVFINIDDPEKSTLIEEIDKAITFFEESKKNLKTYKFNEKVEFEDDMTVKEEALPRPMRSAPGKAMY